MVTQLNYLLFYQIPVNYSTRFSGNPMRQKATDNRIEHNQVTDKYKKFKC